MHTSLTRVSWRRLASKFLHSRTSQQSLWRHDRPSMFCRIAINIRLRTPKKHTSLHRVMLFPGVDCRASYTHSDANDLPLPPLDIVECRMSHGSSHAVTVGSQTPTMDETTYPSPIISLITLDRRTCVPTSIPSASPSASPSPLLEQRKEIEVSTTGWCQRNMDWRSEGLSNR